jgi:hypothetical protein
MTKDPSAREYVVYSPLFKEILVVRLKGVLSGNNNCPSRDVTLGWATQLEKQHWQEKGGKRYHDQSGSIEKEQQGIDSGEEVSISVNTTAAGNVNGTFWQSVKTTSNGA